MMKKIKQHKNKQANKQTNKQSNNKKQKQKTIILNDNEDVQIRHFTHLAFARMSGESSVGDSSLCSCAVTFFEC